MLSFPNCKINLGLHIIGKRKDGFHNLETVFFPLLFTDVLEIIRLHDSDVQATPLFTATGLPILGNPSNNLCLKAYQLLKKTFPILPAIKMHLHKIIPMGAGLGGGSADAAFTLKLLNQIFQLNLTQNQLLQYAAELGSDCPFFISNQPSFAEGRGELLTPVDLNLSAFTFALVHPSIHINTKWAFEQIKPSKPTHSIQEIIMAPIETWKHKLHNDFETPIANAHPVIKEIKNKLYQTGAIYASMSGSGSTVFGIYPKGEVPPLHTYFRHPTNLVTAG